MYATLPSVEQRLSKKQRLGEFCFSAGYNGRMQQIERHSLSIIIKVAPSNQSCISYLLIPFYKPMHFVKSSIISLMLLVAFCQAGPVPPQQDTQGTVQGTAIPSNPALEKCEQECKTFASPSFQNRCKDECFYKYAGTRR